MDLFRVRRPRRSWAWCLVFVSGAAGVIGFFAPFLEVRHDDGILAGSPSGYELVCGGAHVTNATLSLLVGAAYLPSLLLIAVGLSAVMSDRLARRARYPAIVIALVGTVAWALLFLLMQDSKLVAMAIGGHAPLLAGLGGLIGSVAANAR